MLIQNHFLGGRFGYFLFFLFRGGGRGRRRPRRWPGGRFFIKNIGGGGSEEDAREGEGRQGECLWGGGLNIFFRGRNADQVSEPQPPHTRKNLNKCSCENGRKIDIFGHIFDHHVALLQCMWGLGFPKTFPIDVQGHPQNRIGFARIIKEVSMWIEIQRKAAQSPPPTKS